MDEPGSNIPSATSRSGRRRGMERRLRAAAVAAELRMMMITKSSTGLARLEGETCRKMVAFSFCGKNHTGFFLFLLKRGSLVGLSLPFAMVYGLEYTRRMTRRC